jgi:hypothetical protein
MQEERADLDSSQPTSCEPHMDVTAHEDERAVTEKTCAGSLKAARHSPHSDGHGCRAEGGGERPQI